MPKLKGISFETAIIERYRRRESSVEDALIEMYLAGVSVRRVEDITETLWGSKVAPSSISELNKKAYDYSAFTEKERSSEKACCCETCCSCTESGNAENGRGIRKGA